MVDNMVQAMDDEIKKIVCMITELDELAYATYKPMVEEICARKASELYTYKDMYEEAENDSTCANFAHVDDNEEND